LAAISLLAVLGCQRGGQPTAAVNGPNGETATSGTDAGAAPKEAQDPLHPVVVFDTSMGSFTVRLDAEKAPLSVGNFLRYVAAKHYDETIFHQVQKDYPKVVLGGAFTANLKEKPGLNPSVRNEAHNGLKNRRGTLAMARQPDIIDSATAMFFINLADNEILDFKERTPEHYGYCVFGEVIDGLNVLDSIARVPVRDTQQVQNTPVETVAIKSVRLR
jgi:peptidyl-prolyl cis-trans isomerase B (cyclophilin B)